MVELHHENWDGTGYPRGLKGEETPRIARIVKVADAYDAMTSDRPYRRGMQHDQAIGILEKHAGTQFDVRGGAGVRHLGRYQSNARPPAKSRSGIRFNISQRPCVWEPRRRAGRRGGDPRMILKIGLLCGMAAVVWAQEAESGFELRSTVSARVRLFARSDGGSARRRADDRRISGAALSHLEAELALGGLGRDRGSLAAVFPGRI